MKTNKLRGCLLLGLCLIAPISVNATAFATTTKTTTTAPTASQQLRVSPLRSDLSIQPGASGTVKVYITNLTKSQIVVQPIENDFVAGDEEGSPALILDPNSYAPSHSLKRFMVPLQNVTLAGGATAPVTVTITVPKTAQAGGYFGAVRFSPLQDGVTGKTAVDLGESVASLILLTVPGPTTEQLTLTTFAIEQNGGTATNFRTPNNLSLLVRFQNKGNVQEAPFGQVYVQKGKKTLYKYNFNQTDPKSEILPDSTRRWTVPIKGMGKFGKYTVGAVFSYGTKGQSIEITKTVWIIPTAYIIVVIVGVVLLIVLVGGSFLFLRSYKRRILKSSRRRY